MAEITLDMFGGVLFRDVIPEYLMRSGGLPVIPTPLARFEKRKEQLNQNSFDTRGCTYSANMTEGANNWYADWTNEDIAWFQDNKKNYGWSGAGMYMDRAVDMYCDRQNMKHPEQYRTSQPIDFYTQRKKYLDMGYMIMIGSMINEQYLEDAKDGKIDSPWGKDGIGHVRSLFLHTAYPCEALCENFLGVLPFNVIDLVAMDKLIAANQFYHTAFIIYPSGKMPEQIPLPYSHGTTPSEKEIVRAWEEAFATGMKFHYINYVDDFYINKMLIDLAFARN